jgi:hypothetical protein
VLPDDIGAGGGRCASALICLLQGGENFISRAEGLLIAIPQQQDFIGQREYARSMRHDDDRGSASLESSQCIGECGIAGFIEA